MKVVLDAMGGDHAPHVPVMGAIQAAKDYGINIILVGDESEIKKELSKYSFPAERIEVVHADESVSMMSSHPEL